MGFNSGFKGLNSMATKSEPVKFNFTHYSLASLLSGMKLAECN